MKKLISNTMFDLPIESGALNRLKRKTIKHNKNYVLTDSWVTVQWYNTDASRRNTHIGKAGKGEKQ